eukprot:m.304483 g.304483  ORF g.304483 m.304483 type:complete len:102 (+) comp16944_c0_seq1:93-398(+)
MCSARKCCNHCDYPAARAREDVKRSCTCSLTRRVRAYGVVLNVHILVLDGSSVRGCEPYCLCAVHKRFVEAVRLVGLHVLGLGAVPRRQLCQLLMFLSSWS